MVAISKIKAGLTGALLVAGSVVAQASDTVVRNAKVYTVNGSQPWAEAVAIEDGRIAFVGSESEIDLYIQADTQVIDAEGRLVLPGFVDSHNHVAYGTDTPGVNLSEAKDLAAFRTMLSTYADANPELEWIIADGWYYGIFPGDIPTWQDLEGIGNGRPMLLTSGDAHTSLFNKAALDLMGIDGETEDVPFGELVKDADGNPTGVVKATLYAPNAGYDFLSQFLPKPDPEVDYQRLIGNLEKATRLGITTIVEPQNYLDDLYLYERAYEEGKIKSYLSLAMLYATDSTKAELRDFAQARYRFRNNPHIKIDAVKLYIDDVIEAGTAAMLKPYANAPGNLGRTFFSQEKLNKIVQDLELEGFRVFIHAIGDRGTRIALNAFESAREKNRFGNTRHQLVHVEMVHPDDIPRFAELGVVACMQPRHAALSFNTPWARAVGAFRFKGAWPFRSLEQAGAVIAFSSDYDVAEMDPLIGIYSAVTRQDENGIPEGGWVPGERVSVETAIRAYTLNGAYSVAVDRERGSIEVGKFADMVLLSQNLFEIEPKDILNTQVTMTLFEGEIVFER